MSWIDGFPRCPATETTSRLRLLTVFLVISAVAVGMSIATSVAQAADSDTETIELEPGDNFIGWVAEPIAVADIFKAIPQAALIYRWDADSRTYQYAIREMDGNLETLQPGMAAKIRISGSEPVEWERPLTPAKGSMTLYSGTNWVAWNGRDEWPLDEVARGIGKSLVSIEVRGLAYQSDSNITDTINPLEGDTKIRRGDALRVTVNRDLRWLQPTGMMPNTVYVGDIPESLQEEISADIQRVVDFFAEDFAIESDFSGTTIVIYESVDALVNYRDSGVEPTLGTPPGWVREDFAQIGNPAFPWGTLIRSCTWSPPCREPSFEKGIQLLTHEMFHIVQYHLTQSERLAETPDWLNEGSAMWTEWRVPSEFHAPSIVSYQTYLDRLLDDAARTSVTLPGIEEHSHIWAYRLGHLASRRLAELSSADAIPELYRLMLPQIIGKERRWVEQPQWKAAFKTAFGLTTTEFYQQFAAWRETLPAPKLRYDYNYGDVALSGTIHYSDGSPATGFRVNTANPPGEPRTGIERGTYVDEDGKFSIDLAPQSKQRIWITRDGCTLWLVEDGLTAIQGQPREHRDLDTSSLPILNLIVPEGACQNELRARVYRLRDDGRHVSLYLRDAESNKQVLSHNSESAGVLYRHAAEPGAYRLRIRLDGCELTYAKDGLVPSLQQGDVVQLGGRPVSIEFRIPDQFCIYRISGQIRHEDGTAAGGVRLHMGAGDSYSSDAVAADGTFDFAVPESGEYVLQVLTDAANCWIYYSESGATTDWHRATPITVADEDVTGIEFVVPNDPASLCE